MAKKQIVIFSKDEDKETYHYQFRDVAKPIDLLMISVMLDDMLQKEFKASLLQINKFKRELNSKLFETKEDDKKEE